MFRPEYFQWKNVALLFFQNVYKYTLDVDVDMVPDY